MYRKYFHKNKTNKKMKKINVIFAGALTAMSLLTIGAFYFQVLPMIVLTITYCFSAFIAFAVMMSVYHYNGYDVNIGQYWLAYSAMGGVIIIALLYATGMHFINAHLAESIIVGMSPTTVPVIGLFLGDCGRIIVKDEAPAV